MKASDVLRLGRAAGVPVLFAILLALQALDLHSSLTAGAGQTETNRFIQGVANWMSPAAAVLLVKSCAAAVVVALFRVWRSARALDLEFAACLATLVVVYAFVVTNNYLSR